MTRGKRRKEGTRHHASWAEGVKAPDFSLPRDGGGTLSLADFRGQKLVVFFYPKADTPGCTIESKDFSALQKAFKAAGTAVVGVSADPVKKQDAFKAKHDLAVPARLRRDPPHARGLRRVGEKSMYGKTLMGTFRTTFLIGADGHVARTWRKIKAEGHASEVLAAAKTV